MIIFHFTATFFKHSFLAKLVSPGSTTHEEERKIHEYEPASNLGLDWGWRLRNPDSGQNGFACFICVGFFIFRLIPDEWREDTELGDDTILRAWY